MKIENVTKITAFRIVTNEDEYCNYTRHSADVWTVVMGESEESVNDCKELEKLFQNYLDKLNK